MLRYVGCGQFLPGVPARDLTDEEAGIYGGKRALVETGLYKDARTNYPERTKKTVASGLDRDPDGEDN